MNSASVPDTWARGSPYEQYIGRWSRKIAPLFLDWLSQPQRKSWLDVGCGTGALSAAIADRCSPSRLVGVEPSEAFLKSASESLGEKAALQLGDAAAIPLPNTAVDCVVSGLVLNFVPDVAAALVEMRRVTKPGGLIAAYVWDYEGKMDLIRHFWDGAVSLDADARRLHEGARFPICKPMALTRAFKSAGLEQIEVRALDAVAEFGSFEEYWLPFLGGQGPAPAYAMSLDEELRSRLKAAVRAQVPEAPDGRISLCIRAWAIRALTPSDA